VFGISIGVLTSTVGVNARDVRRGWSSPRSVLCHAVRSGRGAVVAAAVVGVASLAVAHGLGYDAWSWMVWARELVHGSLSTAGGPSLMPLPVLLVSPLTPLGDLGPLAWLALQRTSALLAVWLAWRVGARLAGQVAGWIAALVLLVSPDLGVTALYGSSEPLLLVLVLAAVECHLLGRDRHAFVLLGVAGLIRPEVWPIIVVLAIVWWRRNGRPDVLVLASVTLPPAVWFAMTWLGSGSPFTQLRGAPGGYYDGGIAALGGATGAIALPALGLAAFAAIDAVRRHEREITLVAIVAVGWVLIVATMTQLGYPGTRRYFAAPAALLALLAGVATARLLRRTSPPVARVAAPALALLIAVSALSTVMSTARTVGVARTQDRDLAQLREAVALAGGRDAVLAVGRPAVNPARQSALAWLLNAPLGRVQATWHSTAADPHWHPPAIVFSGPRHRAGPTPARPRRWPLRPIGRAGAWDIVQAARPPAHS
jgi:4-amino-4-deoxy-L-arabinose transferase-like glycosyltransferase